MVKIQSLFTKRAAGLVVVALIAGSLATWCRLMFGSDVGSGDFTTVGVLLRVVIYSGLAFATMLLLSPVANGLRRFMRWLFCWRTIKRGFVAGVGLLGFVLLFHAEENWRGRRAWEQFKREWEAKGEQFDFASFVPPSVPDDQNFALTPIVASCYRRVLDRTGHRLQSGNTNVVNRLEMEIYRAGIPAGTNLVSGRWQASQFTDVKAWQNHYRTMSLTNEVIVGGAAGERGITSHEVRPLTTNEFPITAQPQSPAADVRLALSKYDSALEELREASRLPHARFPLAYAANNPAEMVFPHYESLKATASVLRLRTIAELNDEQPGSALADVQLMLFLADSIRGEPLAWSLRTRLQIVDSAIQPVWEGLARRQWSDGQLLALERALGRFDVLREYRVVLRSDLAWRLKSIEYLRVERMANSVDCMCGDPMFWPTLAYRLAPSGWFYLNMVALARCYQAALPTHAEWSQGVLPPDISRRFEATMIQVRSEHRSVDNPFVGFSLPSLEREANTCARTQTSVDLARVACALERFRQANGDFPESLNALAPMWLSKIPHDVVNGQPLCYRRTESGSFLLYSVGWNEADDGGEPAPSSYFPFGISKPTGDWVWRYPAD